MITRENFTIPRTSSSRCSIFAHFDMNDLVDDYVFYYLENLRKVSSEIIFISTSNLTMALVEQLKRLCNTVIIRENIGYDFMSWRVGIDSLSQIDLYDELIICNDSVYGPFYSLEAVFNTMRQKECDFWGLTESHEISYHLQSYFIVFKKAVFCSSPFKNFWTSVSPTSIKQQVVKKYEVGLTQILLQANFKPGVYISHQTTNWSILKGLDISLMLQRPQKTLKLFIKALKAILHKQNLFYGKGLNLTHFSWRDLIVNYKMPFLKIELLRDNPRSIHLNNYDAVIRRYSDYNVSLIHKHLERIKRSVQPTQDQR